MIEIKQHIGNVIELLRGFIVKWWLYLSIALVLVIGGIAFWAYSGSSSSDSGSSSSTNSSLTTNDSDSNKPSTPTISDSQVTSSRPTVSDDTSDKKSFSILWVFLVIVAAGGAGGFLYVYQKDIILKSNFKKNNIATPYSIFDLNKLRKAEYPLENLFSELVRAGKNQISVTYKELISLYDKKVKAANFIDTMIRAKENNINLSFLKSFYLSNGEVQDLVDAYITLIEGDIEVEFEDLIDIFFAVNDFKAFSFKLISLEKYGYEIDLSDLVERHFNKKEVIRIIDSAYEAISNGVDVSLSDIESHIASRGNVELVVQALIRATKARLDVSFHHLAHLDMFGLPLMALVDKAIKPLTNTFSKDATTKDRYPVVVRYQITHKVNLKHYNDNSVDTVFARVNEALVSAVGSIKTHKELFENYEQVSKKLMTMDLDENSCLDIMSISIIKVEPGKEIDTEMRLKQTENEKKIAIAQSELRKIYAELQAREARADIKAAEARIKNAYAKASEAWADRIQNENAIEDAQTIESTDLPIEKDDTKNNTIEHDS